MVTLRIKRKPVVRAVALAVMFVMLAGLLPTNWQSAKATVKASDVNNPSRASNGIATWDCVEFGEYPQKEITKKDAMYDELVKATKDADGDTIITVGNNRYYAAGDIFDFIAGRARYFRYEPIKWRVLSVDGDDAVLLADQNLDCKPYNELTAMQNWETCTLRSWLNGYFLKNAFSEKEQAAIEATNRTNDEETTDKVYLLSASEARNKKYGFSSDRTRRAKNTDYARAHGVNNDNNGGECEGNGWWWTQSPGGSMSMFVAVVFANGYIHDSGYYADKSRDGVGAVRPVLRLNLKSEGWSYAGTVSSDGTGEQRASEATCLSHNPNRASDGTVTWDCVWFGNYWKSDTNGDRIADTSDGKQPIKWRVLSVDGDDAVLLADQNLDCKPYNELTAMQSWETCTLRSWLNEYFLKNAFSEKEQAAIEATNRTNDEENTDKVYLLSAGEARNTKYGFSSQSGTLDRARRAKNTDYARAQGANTYNKGGEYVGNGWWWTQAPGGGSTHVAVVHADGYVHDSGNFANTSEGAVRPVLRLNLKSEGWSYAGTVSSDGTEKELGNEAISNKSIIKRVSEYTSDETIKELDVIINGNYSNEVKRKSLYDLFVYYGVTDPKNLIDYLGKTSDKRFAYAFLTNNDIYCASNFQYILDHTAKGSVIRAELLLANLALNREIEDYIDIRTYLEQAPPGLRKYKAMLYDFMDATSEKIEVQAKVKLLLNLSQHVTGAAKLRADNLTGKLNACETIEETEKLIESNEAKGVFAELGEQNEDGKTVLSFKLDETSGFGKFAKNMKLGARTITVSKLTVTDAMDLLTFDAKLQIYDQYRTFLEDIVSYDGYMPGQLRWAASQILYELDSGYCSQMQKITLDILEQTKLQELNENTLKKILGKAKAKNFSEILMVANITSFFIDRATNVGQMLEAASSVEGYAYLSRAFTEKLEASKKAFIKEKTEENAWDFYYNYNILYKLRKKGEEAYLKMTEVKGIITILSDFGYSEKEAAVNEILAQMEKSCKFTFDSAVSMPESRRFATKTTISCPVNVDVYTPEGELVASLVDGKKSNFENEHGKFAVMYDAYSGEYVKVIGLYDDRNYKFKITGIDDGLVNLELAQTDGDTKAMYAFSNVLIRKEASIRTSIKQLTEEKTYNMDTNGDGIEDNKGQVYEKPDAYVAVSHIALESGTLELQRGKYATLQIEATPNNASNQEVSWISTNPDIVTVSDGKVTAIEEGTATVHCRSLDNPDLMGSCEVTVVSDSPKLFGSAKSLRIAGLERVETSMMAADSLKKCQGIEKFENIIVACGSDYPDALTGSYLAKVKKAPMLLVQPTKASEDRVKAYVSSNLKNGGTVYILGGTGVVSKRFENSLGSLNTERLYGDNRYMTNLAILKEAGGSNEELIVCSGQNYADSLSASAAGKPIMLAAGSLSSAQAEYLGSLSPEDIYVIGGVGAVSSKIEKDCGKYAYVERIYGDDRYKTSVAVAKEFFNGKCKNAVLARAYDFPDGLSGGPLAMSIGAPLLLVENTAYQDAAEYAGAAGISRVAILGGPALISEQVVGAIIN